MDSLAQRAEGSLTTASLPLVTAQFVWVLTAPCGISLTVASLPWLQKVARAHRLVALCVPLMVALSVSRV